VACESAYHKRVCLALKAPTHDSLGQRPRGSILHSERALKARLNARLNRAFSAGLCIYGLPWGVAPGSDEHRAFGAKGTRAGTHAVLPWRPGQRTLAQQVDMQMWDTFTRVGPAIDHDTVTLRQLQFLCHVARDQQ
jgi:hypothetical protein